MHLGDQGKTRRKEIDGVCVEEPLGLLLGKPNLELPVLTSCYLPPNSCNSDRSENNSDGISDEREIQFAVTLLANSARADGRIARIALSFASQSIIVDGHITRVFE